MISSVSWCLPMVATAVFQTAIITLGAKSQKVQARSTAMLSFLHPMSCVVSPTHLLMDFFQVSRGPCLALCCRCACKTLKHSSQKHPRDCNGLFSSSFHLPPSSIQPSTSTYFSSGNTQNLEEKLSKPHNLHLQAQ